MACRGTALVEVYTSLSFRIVPGPKTIRPEHTFFLQMRYLYRKETRCPFIPARLKFCLFTVCPDYRAVNSWPTRFFWCVNAAFVRICCLDSFSPCKNKVCPKKPDVTFDAVIWTRPEPKRYVCYQAWGPGQTPYRPLLVAVSWSVSDQNGMLNIIAYIQGVSGGIVNILGGCIIDYSE
jgi:hypothetical protein